MEYYLIKSGNQKENHIKAFQTKEECYHWVVNNLDLSMNWSFEVIEAIGE